MATSITPLSSRGITPPGSRGTPAPNAPVVRPTGTGAPASGVPLTARQASPSPAARQSMMTRSTSGLSALKKFSDQASAMEAGKKALGSMVDSRLKFSASTQANAGTGLDGGASVSVNNNSGWHKGSTQESETALGKLGEKRGVWAGIQKETAKSDTQMSLSVGGKLVAGSKHKLNGKGELSEGQYSGHGKSSNGVRLAGSMEARIGTDGVAAEAAASVRAGSHSTINLQANHGSLETTLNGHLFAGARASGQASINASLGDHSQGIEPALSASVSANAFAGVQTGFTGTMSMPGLKVTGSIGAAAGIGVHGSANASQSGGVFSAGVGVGGALGAGGSVSLSVDIDAKAMAQAAKETAFPMENVSGGDPLKAQQHMAKMDAMWYGA